MEVRQLSKEEKSKKTPIDYKKLIQQRAANRTITLKQILREKVEKADKREE